MTKPMKVFPFVKSMPLPYARLSVTYVVISATALLSMNAVAQISSTEESDLVTIVLDETIHPDARDWGIIQTEEPESLYEEPTTVEADQISSAATNTILPTIYGSSLPPGFEGSAQDLKNIQRSVSPPEPESGWLVPGNVYLRGQMNKPEKRKPTLKTDAFHL